MSPRHTWFWVILAAGFLAFILVFQRLKPEPLAGPTRILSELNVSSVTAIQVRPASPSLAIRAERTNGGWQLVQPLAYPAQSTNVDRLVEALAGLLPAAFITPAELRAHRNPEEEYGFASPQASIAIQQGDSRTLLLVGAMTTPGDQVFLQVDAREGVYVTDAAWLKFLPKSVNDWRDTSVLLADIHSFDRLAATNNSRAFVLQRDPNHLWRMVWPLNAARADNARIHDALSKLEQLQIQQFVSDDPRTDLESLGLAPPALEVSLGSGTNVALVLQIGKNVPTATNQVYARRLGQPSVFTVADESLSSWRNASVNDFRDPHLLTLTSPVGAVEVRGEETFSIERRTNDTWRVLPENLPADPARVRELLVALTRLPIIQFTKDVVNPPDLPQFGLASPARQYIVKAVATNAPAHATNCVIAELNFGVVTNQADKVFVWRPDESSVYAVATSDFAKLPANGWQLRERKFWNFTAEDVAGLAIRQRGKTRELIRNAAHRWAFAPGSQGIINDLAVEETVRGMVQASAVVWVARGEPARQVYGLGDNAFQIAIKLKDGGEATLEFGKEAPSTNQYAGVVLDGQLWVFEFPWILYRDVSSYLSIP